jgi:hypothetical protein
MPRKTLKLRTVPNPGQNLLPDRPYDRHDMGGDQTAKFFRLRVLRVFATSQG